MSKYQDCLWCGCVVGYAGLNEHPTDRECISALAQRITDLEATIVKIQQTTTQPTPHGN